jgi:hypothetical protein
MSAEAALADITTPQMVANGGSLMGSVGVETSPAEKVSQQGSDSSPAESAHSGVTSFPVPVDVRPSPHDKPCRSEQCTSFAGEQDS